MIYVKPSLFYQFQNELFINSDWLSEQYLIPIKTIKNGVSKFRKNGGETWIAQKNARKQFINYSSIPANTASRYKLPNLEQMVEKLKAEEHYSKDQKVKKEVNFHKLLIECALTKYRSFLNHYHDYQLPTEECLRLAKSHAVLDLLISFNNITVKEKYVLYNQVYDESFAFKATDYCYFAAKLREMANVGIANSLTKKYFGNTNAVKLTIRIKKAIMHLYKQEIKLSSSQITQLVNSFFVAQGYPAVSQTTVYTTIKSDPKLQNILKFQRDGEKWAKDKLYPKLARIHATYPGDLYEIDGTRVQIAYKGINNKPSFLVMVILLDVCTRKVLAVEFGETESGEMYEAVLRKSIKAYKFLPAEILTDNFSPLLNPKSGFSELLTLMEQRGTTWRKHQPGNARDKGHIESFFKRFQHQYCKYIEGYVGEGVTSKNPDAHPSQEFIAKSLKSGHLRTKAQLIDRVTALIQNYNNEILDKETFEKDCPNFQFDDLDKPNVINLNDRDIPRFIYELKIKKATNCCVCIRINKTPYYYEIDDIPSAIAMNGSNVELRFDQPDGVPEKVFCYNPTSGAFLGEAYRKEPVHMAKANQTELDVKRIGTFYNRKKKIKEYIQSEIEAFDIAANQLDPDLALLNPIRYTKDEIKKAEDLTVLQLIKAPPLVKQSGKIKSTIKVLDNNLNTDNGGNLRIVRFQDLNNSRKNH